MDGSPKEQGGAQEEAQSTRPLDEGVREVRDILVSNLGMNKGIPDAAPRILSEKPIERIERDSYNKMIPNTEGMTEGIPGTGPDARVFRVVYKDGTESYVISCRESDNPWANLSLMGGGDFRVWRTYLYEWDGKETIKATTFDGRTQTVSGEYGKPEKMLEGVIPRNWRLNEKATFTPQPAPQQAAA